MAGNVRSRRVADQILHELGWLIDRKLKDPKIGFVTLTRVKLSPDMKLASVYYSVLGKEQNKIDSQEALSRAIPYLKHELGIKSTLKYLPDLRFFYDDSLDYAEHISKIIKNIHKDDDNR